MKRSWRWWRRVREGEGGCQRKEVAVLTSQLPPGTRLASSEGWAAAAAGWARGLQRGPGRFHPIVRSVVPYALRLSTATSASSRRRSISPEKEDEEADGEFGTRINVQGREIETKSEIEEWEEEDDADPQIGDGGDGGGINLGNVAWGEHALSMANEVLRCNFSDDLKMFAFKISPKGYIYIRLDKISNRDVENILSSKLIQNQKIFGLKVYLDVGNLS
ncbi:unnamed protein product [Spirodela intermedia]|uniref:Uncharacterized protein n=1 Tax=Spirodela intermedia TaxID=51605 RepID=A0A7I8LFS7_SPIIN|nr:unnamed protein product [Spirodela intermedia]